MSWHGWLGSGNVRKVCFSSEKKGEGFNAGTRRRKDLVGGWVFK